MNNVSTSPSITVQKVDGNSSTLFLYCNMCTLNYLFFIFFYIFSKTWNWPHRGQNLIHFYYLESIIKETTY